ncbi:hypothetical protein Rhe02_53870 [Rhizocola hellebori]|uniref:NACHT domain-containing protein n=1 Tax=Rhizocola hellebori TaxID=1392758 RepID=A0A8J3QB60_9ACTN|nr:NACHT domain-containing protein [Rhizocola hellebori]GIH07320.1 hypothetical protein Rhe02_53870 [Rhizocola hellebori]
MWQELISNGWLVAAVLFVLLIFRDAVVGWMTKAFTAAGEALYSRFAGSRLWQQRALDRYRRSVGSYYAAASESDGYVPLTAKSLDGAVGGQEVAQPIDDQLRTVVTGAPGAGKSMLLRHSMLAWATGAPGWTVPVLCELHRHSGTGLSLEDHLDQQMRRHDFPKAARFIERSLREGHLTVLLDGFDEVSTAERARVGELIKEFAVRYPKTRMVVTCRTADYKAQLIPEMTQRLEVGELEDRMILSFLDRSPKIKGPQQVQRLMESLRDNPRVLQLARNPMLLTMIAELYAGGGDGRQLPRSRAQLFGEAAGGVKTEVLQKIALACMDAAGSADRMTLPHRTVLDITAQTLPSLNESAKYAELIIDEIVERGGLLQRIDGGAQYRFAHLTWQEFLAARELAGDPAALLQRFETDPARWRESVKIWCGTTTKDCTEAIGAVYQLEALAGLECLADAPVVDTELADRLVAEMLTRLRDNPEPSLVAAFGVAATGPGPRGESIYDRLVSLAGFRQAGGIQALAHTNLPKAASLLSQLAETHAEVRPALAGLGELAVPTLAGHAKTGQQWAVDCLAAIATPSAIEALVQQLWAGPSSMLASRAAWRLAALTTSADVAETLRATAPPSVRLGGYDWCWEPFAGPGQGSLPYVMAQICLLLDQPEAAQTRPDDLADIDPRIGVPLCLREFERTGGSPAELKIFRDGLGEYIAAREFSLLVRGWEQELTDHPKPVGLKALVVAMPSPLRPVVVALAAENTYFSRKDWASLTDESTYSFSASPSYRGLFAVVCLTLLGGFALGVGMVTGWWPAPTPGPAWLGWLTVILTAGAAWSATALNMGNSAGNLRLGVIGLLELGTSVVKRRTGQSEIALGVFGLALPFSTILLTVTGYTYLGWPAVALAGALILGTAGIWTAGRRKENRVYSAMRELLPYLGTRSTAMIR